MFISTLVVNVKMLQDENDKFEEIITVGNQKRKHLSDDAKQIVLNVFNFLKSDSDETAPVSKTAKMTQVPDTTVRRIIQEGVPDKKQRTDAGKTRIFNDFEKDVIRRKIYSLYNENIFPSLRVLLEKLKKDCDISCSISTLHSVLRNMGFKYKKIDKRQVLMESRRICQWRYHYLAELRKFREENRPIIYLDETWYDTHDTLSKSWTDGSTNCTAKVPVSRGKRIIILHAGSDQGWVKEALFLSGHNMKNACLDYHDNMTSDIFEEWFRTKLLPNIPENSVIVMDNASYHSRQLYKIPTKSSTKTEIQEFLYQNDIYFEESYSKNELLEVAQTKVVKKVYVCDSMAEKFGHTVLRLPPYYCVLNPIELIWGQLKTSIRRQNVSPTINDNVVELIKSEINNIGDKQWAYSVQHVINIENNYLSATNTK